MCSQRESIVFKLLEYSVELGDPAVKKSSKVMKYVCGILHTYAEGSSGQLIEKEGGRLETKDKICFSSKYQVGSALLALQE